VTAFSATTCALGTAATVFSNRPRGEAAPCSAAPFPVAEVAALLFNPRSRVPAALEAEVLPDATSRLVGVRAAPVPSAAPVVTEPELKAIRCGLGATGIVGVAGVNRTGCGAAALGGVGTLVEGDGRCAMLDCGRVPPRGIWDVGVLEGSARLVGVKLVGSPGRLTGETEFV